MQKRPANKGKRYPAEVLTADEVEALIKACSNQAPTGVRNRALIAVLWRCGLRINEALGLYPKDTNLRAGTLRVVQGRGNKARIVGIGEYAATCLSRWIDRRGKLGISGRNRLFCTLDGSPIKPPYVRALLPRLARKAGIEKRVHAHGLRHTHAATLAQANVPLNVIQAQLGHANIAITSRYLAQVAPQAITVSASHSSRGTRQNRGARRDDLNESSIPNVVLRYMCGCEPPSWDS